jgi:hypothetical protein
MTRDEIGEVPDAGLMEEGRTDPLPALSDPPVPAGLHPL